MEQQILNELMKVGGPVVAGVMALVAAIWVLSVKVLKPIMDSTAQAAKDNAIASAAMKDAVGSAKEATLAAQATVQAANQIMRIAQHMARLDDEGVQRPQ